MEDKCEEIVPSKSSPWVECESKSRPGNKYLFNIATGEQKWLKTEVLPGKKATVTKRFSTPANDRLKRLQRDLLKPKLLSKSEEKGSAINKSQKATTTKKSISTEARPLVTPKDRLKILQSKAIKEQLKNEAQETLNVKATLPKISKKSTETKEVPKCSAKKRSASESATTAEVESLGTPAKCAKNTLKVQQSSCIANETKTHQTQNIENTKKDVKDSDRKQPLQNQETPPSENSETNTPELKFLTEIPNNNFTPLKRLQRSANKRLECFRRSLQNKDIANDKISNSVENSINNSKLECSYEAMDWEPTDEPSTSLLSLDSPELKNNNTVKETSNMKAVAEKKQEIKKLEKKWRKESVYIVLDTNVFIHHLSFIEQLQTKRIKDASDIILYLPYSVLQELDKLKQRENVKVSVVRAIRYLNKIFEEKNEFIQAQSALEEREQLINVESPDDSILNCCLQVQAHVPNVILFSEDVNLRNKAICNNTVVSTKSDLLKKVSTLT